MRGGRGKGQEEQQLGGGGGEGGEVEKRGAGEDSLLPVGSIAVDEGSGEVLKEAVMHNFAAAATLLSPPMASSPPPLSDNPYDNYIKEKPAPPAPVLPTRERCANVHETLMACLMKSKVAPRFSRAKENKSILNALRGPHAARSALKLGGRSGPA